MFPINIIQNILCKKYKTFNKNLNYNKIYPIKLLCEKSCFVGYFLLYKILLYLC